MAQLSTVRGGKRVFVVLLLFLLTSDSRCLTFDNFYVFITYPEDWNSPTIYFVFIFFTLFINPNDGDLFV